MPEVLFAFLLSVTCVCLLAAWWAHSGRAASIAVFGAALSAVALTLVKPHALLMTMLVLVGCHSSSRAPNADASWSLSPEQSPPPCC